MHVKHPIRLHTLVHSYDSLKTCLCNVHEAAHTTSHTMPILKLSLTCASSIAYHLLTSFIKILSSLAYFSREGNSIPILSSVSCSLMILGYTLCNSLMMSHNTIHTRYYFSTLYRLFLTLDPSPYLYHLNTIRFFFKHVYVP